MRNTERSFPLLMVLNHTYTDVGTLMNFGVVEQEKRIEIEGIGKLINDQGRRHAFAKPIDTHLQQIVCITFRRFLSAEGGLQES